MINFINKNAGTIVLVAIVIAIGYLFFGGAKNAYGSIDQGRISFFNAVGVVDGLVVGQYGNYTQLFDSAGNWVNGFVADAGITYSYTSATSTLSTTQTLKAADITGYTTVIFTPNIGSVTLTLPASSTLAAMIPAAGDRAQQCWLNATTTAGINITFAAGTGIDLEVASSTDNTFGGNALVIGSGNSGCFTYIRQNATATTFDITAQFTRFVNGD